MSTPLARRDRTFAQPSSFAEIIDFAEGERSREGPALEGGRGRRDGLD
ncbi:MAG: hypothetical protein GY820_04885 [Gammaproteobacteria bacterium]|nr:hypothetical protein [Gammaproteobacteria bacterium]